MYRAPTSSDGEVTICVTLRSDEFRRFGVKNAVMHHVYFVMIHLRVHSSGNPNPASIAIHERAHGETEENKTKPGTLVAKNMWDSLFNRA